jgi:hypothetical protein
VAVVVVRTSVPLPFADYSVDIVGNNKDNSLLILLSVDIFISK